MRPLFFRGVVRDLSSFAAGLVVLVGWGVEGVSRGRPRGRPLRTSPDGPGVSESTMGAAFLTFCSSSVSSALLALLSELESSELESLEDLPAGSFFLLLA